MSEEGLTARDYEEAITVQDACNLSGVAHSFSRVLEKIWVEARKQGKGTDWVNSHIICKMYVDKLRHLAGDCGMDTFSECELQARE